MKSNPYTIMNAFKDAYTDQVKAFEGAPAASLPEWLVPHQAAQLLGSNLEEVRKLAGQGLIAVKSERGYPRYRRRDVEAQRARLKEDETQRTRLAEATQTQSNREYNEKARASAAQMHALKLSAQLRPAARPASAYADSTQRLDPTQWLTPMHAANMLDTSVDEVRRLSTEGRIQMRTERQYPRYKRQDIEKLRADSSWRQRPKFQAYSSRSAPARSRSADPFAPLRAAGPRYSPATVPARTQPGQLNALLTPVEAARHLGITDRQLQELTTQGKIAYETISGGLLRYRRSTLKLPDGVQIELTPRLHPTRAVKPDPKQPRHWHRYETVSEGDTYDAGSRQLLKVSHKRCTCGVEREVVRKYMPLFGTRVVEIRRIA